MKKSRVLSIMTAAVALLLIGAVAFSAFSDTTPYDGHTGLGDSIDISADDKAIAFSYYENGTEAIYTGTPETGEVQKVTEPENEDHRMPIFSPNGNGLLYLAADGQNVQSLQYLPNGADGEAQQLSAPGSHVVSAAFSPGGDTIYYSAMPASDYLAAEGEQENGVDLFSVAPDGTNRSQLTNQDAFGMDDLSVSADGQTLYYSTFDGTQRLMGFSLEEGTHQAVHPARLSGDTYQHTFSPDGTQLAYTAVSEETQNGGSLFHYDLYRLDLETDETVRLTDYEASITSPVFFRTESRIAFLAQPNWPGDPADYELMTVPADGGEMEPVALELPEAEGTAPASVFIARLINPVTVGALYVLLFGLLTVLVRKPYRPAIISAVLTVLVFISSFAAAAMINPWLGIGLFSVTAGMAVCTAMIFAFAFIYRRTGAER